MRIRAHLKFIFVLCSVMLGAVDSAQSHDSFISVIKHVKPSMVTIKANKKKGFFKSASQRKRDEALGQYKEYFKDGFDKLPTYRNGSGFIIATSESHSWILTAAHVVVGSSKIIVTTANGKKRTATLLNKDSRTDVALLQIPTGQLPTLTLSQSELQEGQSVLGLGAPFGLSISSSRGIVSALDVNLLNHTKAPLIQTDVSINPGSSGGALVNEDAEVVGLISKIYSNTGLFSGSSFAVSAGNIKPLLTKWLKPAASAVQTDKPLSQ